jgi:hypothetical protein
VNDNNQEIPTEAFMLRMQKEHDDQEWRNARRRVFCATGDDLKEEDGLWFKLQLAVWHEQLK